MLRTLKTLLPIAIFFVVACESGTGPDNPGGGGGSSSEELAKIMNDAGAFDDVVPSYEETEPEEFDGGNAEYFCTRQTVDLVEGYSDYPQFDPNSGVIFPGNLLQGDTLDDATPSGIPVDRGPGTVVMTLVNGASSVQRSLTEVSLGNVYDAMNSIIAASPDDLPARTTFTIQQVSSREQLGAALKAEYQTLTAEVKGSFNYQSDVKYNRFLVKLTQSYYTIVFEAPTDPGEFFGDNVTTEQLSRYVQPGNPAGYVSSVTYGRIFYLLIQSTESTQKMKASIEASFDAAVKSGSIEGDIKYVADLDEVEISGYAIGGDSQLANTALLGNFDDLVLFVSEGDRITTGQPISYTVNAANDPAKQLKVKVATSYDIVDCTPIGASLDNGVAWYRSDHGVQTRSYFGTLAVTRWEDLLGEPLNDATVPFGGPDVAAVYPPSGNVSFRFDPGNMTGQMKFPGSLMVESDYTIFAVAMRLGLPPGDNRYTSWMWSDSQIENRGVKIGFADDNTIEISHGGDLKLSAETQNPVFQKFQVFTFRFSQLEGLSIFINGVKVAGDPSITTPIEVFTGGRIGVANETGSSLGVGFASIEMKDLQIYGIAATESQRKYVEKTLLQKYGI